VGSNFRHWASAHELLVAENIGVKGC
jgi:hypothetical protein